MIYLNQASYNALRADRERLDAILEGRVTVERDGPTVHALSHSPETGVRAVMDPNGRNAIDSALRVVRRG